MDSVAIWRDVSARAFVLAGIVAAAGGATAAPLSIAIQSDASGVCRTGVVSARPICAAGPCGDETTIRWRVDAGERALAVIDAAEAEAWVIRVEAPRCWAADVPVRREDGAHAVPVRLWRAGIVTGRAILPESVQPPDTVAVRVDSDSIPAADVRCPVIGGRFRCSLPAARLHLRVAPEGVAPQYRSDVEVRAEGTTDLGDIRFGRGGAITGTVRFAGDGPPLSSVRLELVPTLPPRNAEDVQRLTTPRESARPNPRGFFHFPHLEPGQYTVTASIDGWSSVREAEIRVTAGRETSLTAPLVIEPLARVEVAVLPPLDPFGQPWRVSLHQLTPIAGTSIAVADALATLTGHWSADRVHGGIHKIDITDHRGNAFARSVVEVSPRMAPVQITVDAVAVDGVVRLGDTPLQARLEFRNRGGAMVVFRSDGEGRFSGALPTDGSWDVEVEARKSVLVKRTVKIRRGDGAATVELALPDTTIDVAVVSDGGNPVPARVRALDAEGRVLATASTDQAGRVQLAGIDARDLRLSATARAEGAASGAVPVQLDDDGRAEITLVVRPQVRFRGWLVTPDGHPVAGAFVRWIAPHRNAYLEDVSGPSGEFEIVLPHDVGVLDLVILPPAMPVKLLTVAIHADMDARQEIVVGGPSGVLEIAMSHNPPYPVIRRGGRAVSTMMLRYPLNWTTPPRDRRPSGLVLTLEAGDYAVCSPDGARCAPVTLASGAVERVDGAELLR